MYRKLVSILKGHSVIFRGPRQVRMTTRYQSFSVKPDGIEVVLNIHDGKKSIWKGAQVVNGKIMAGPIVEFKIIYADGETHSWNGVEVFAGGRLKAGACRQFRVLGGRGSDGSEILYEGVNIDNGGWVKSAIRFTRFHWEGGSRTFEGYPQDSQGKLVGGRCKRVEDIHPQGNSTVFEDILVSPSERLLPCRFKTLRTFSRTGLCLSWSDYPILDSNRRVIIRDHLWTQV